MGVRFTLDYIKQECLKHGLECLDDEYISTEVEMHFRCKCGKIFGITWHHIKRNWCCTECSNKRRWKMEDIRQECLEHDVECLEEDNKGSDKKMKFKCKCGNIYEAYWHYVKSANKWQCNQCSRNKRKPKIDYIKQECLKHGIECLDNKYISNITKMKFKCKCGKIYETRWKSVKNKWQCPNCSNVPKLTLQDIKQECENHNLLCLSDEYKNLQTKMSFKCKCGNIYEMSWASARRKWQCPTCSNNEQKLNLEHVKNECKNHNMECLSDVYVNAQSKMKFRCSCGNIYETTWNSVKSRDQWQCQTCGNEKQKLNLQDIKHECLEHNLECLEDKYINNNTNMTFKCNCGETYKATWRSVKYQNKWKCNKCAKVMSIGEIITQEYLDSKNYSYTMQDSLGCINQETGRYLPYDFVIRQEDKVIVIEVDGKQHYEDVGFFGGKEALKLTQYRDGIKEQFCKDNGYILYRVIWTNRSSGKAKLLKQLEKILG